MNFTNLLYFVTVAEESSISKAAKKLYMSQQSLSNQILRLEQEFGVELFDHNQGFKLTYAGECTLRTVKEILSLNRQMHTQIDDIVNQRKGRLNIGIATRVCGSIVLPEVLPQFHNLYPEIELHLETGLTMTLLEHLKQGSLDIILGIQFPEIPGTVSFELYQEQLCLLVPRRIMNGLFPENLNNAIRSFSQNGVDLSVFRDAPFLLMEEGKRVRTYSDLICRKQDFSPNVILQSTDLDTLFGLCCSGLGSMFAFEKSIQRNFSSQNPFENGKDSKVFVFPLKDPDVIGHTMIYLSATQYHSKAVKNFVDLIFSAYSLPPVDLSRLSQKRISLSVEND